MPIEYVNYTISTINGTLWATVDGNFPIQVPSSQVGKDLPMLYPTPPGTTNISIELYGQKVNYSNYTETYPNMLHYTYLGEWSMILFQIQPTSTDFIVKIHYTHPILETNGTYMFLYDLNISPYLSNSSIESVAYFNVHFQTTVSNIMVFNVPGDSSIPLTTTKTPINFTINNLQQGQLVTFNITSDYSKPIPGDELITFQNLQSQIPEFPSATILSAFTIVLVFAASLILEGKVRINRNQTATIEKQVSIWGCIQDLN